MTIKVYCYKAKPPIDGGNDLAASEISGAHRYFNAIIEIERDRLTRKAELRRQHLPGLDCAETAIAAAEAEIQSLRDGIKARNATERRKRATAEDREAIRQAKEWLDRMRSLRTMVMAGVEDSTDYTSALTLLHADCGESKRAAYNAAECGWGTRLKIAEAVERAVDGCTDADLPRFRRWNGDGLCAVQLQRGLTVAKLMEGGDQRLSFAWLPLTGTRTCRTSARPALVSLRVRSDEHKRPIWLKVPIWIGPQYPLPADGIIKWAVLVRRAGPMRRQSDGSWWPYWQWSVNFTVATSEVKTCAASGVCGVDLGWRLMEDGTLRVAYWVGSDGEKGELRVDPGRWGYIADLQSIRTGIFNDARGMLVKWLVQQPRLPEWLAEETASLDQWRSPARLCRLVERWQGVAGDEGIVALLRAWREREGHLLQIERDVAAKAERWRRGFFRSFARMLAKRYSVLSVEDCDWRKLARLPTTESNETVNETARRNQRIASVGLLRQCLAQSGADVRFSRTEGTTRECCVCGAWPAEGWDAAAELMYRCSNGHVRDQDEGAARNLLARATVVEPGQDDVASVNSYDGNGLCAGNANIAARVSEVAEGEGVATNTNGAKGRWGRRKVKALARTAESEGGEMV